MIKYFVEPRPEERGVLVTLNVEAARLVADALDIVSPDDNDAEAAARNLAWEVRTTAARDDDAS